jgi:O-antigen/teichoic acid export membrane protein
MNKNRFFTIALSYFNIFFYYLLVFLITPILITRFGNEDFGIYRLVLSITTFIALLDFGFSNGIIKFFSQFIITNDNKSIYKSFTILLIVSIIYIFIVCFFIAFFFLNFEHLFPLFTSESQKTLVINLIIIQSLISFLSLINNFIVSILKSFEKFLTIQIINFFRNLSRTLLFFILLFYTDNILFISLIDLFVGFSFLIFFIITLLKILKFLNINFKLFYFDKKLLMNFLLYNSIIFFDTLAFHLLWNSDLFIINLIEGPSNIAVYSVVVQLTTFFFGFSLVISELIMPKIIKKIASNSSNIEILYEIKNISSLKFFVITLPFIGFFLLGRNFIGYWVGGNFEETFYLAFSIMIPIYIASLFDTGLYVMWAKNKHLPKTVFSLIISFINIILTFYLVKEIGILGATISTVFSYFVINVLFNFFYFNFFLKIDMIFLIKNVFINKMLFLLFFTTNSFLISILFPNNIYYFIIKVILISLIYLLLYYLFLSNNDKNAVASFFKKRKVI